MGERSPGAPATLFADYLAWFLGGAVAGVAIAWVAATLNFHRLAPIGILSIGVGIALALSLHALARWRRLSSRLFFGAALLALVTVLAEHVWLYSQFRRGWQASRAESAQIAMFRPEAPWSPGEYLNREIQAGSLPYWCLDAALILLATLVTLHLLSGHNESSMPSPSSDPKP